MESAVQGVTLEAAGESEAVRLHRAGRRIQGAQSQNARYDAPDVVVNRHEAFGVELAERDMKCPQFFPHLPQAIQRKIDTLADADSGGADEQQSVGRQIVDVAEFLIQPLIVLRGKRLGQITGRGRKILSANEAGLEGMAVVDQVLKQTAKHE